MKDFQLLSDSETNLAPVSVLRWKYSTINRLIICQAWGPHFCPLYLSILYSLYHYSLSFTLLQQRQGTDCLLCLCQQIRSLPRFAQYNLNNGVCCFIIKIRIRNVAKRGFYICSFSRYLMHFIPFLNWKMKLSFTSRNLDWQMFKNHTRLHCEPSILLNPTSGQQDRN